MTEQPPPPIHPLAALAALAGGGLAVSWASPPTGVPALSLVMWAPAIVVLGRLTGWRAFLGGWLLGACMQAGLFPWLVPTIVRFSTIPLAGAIGVLVLYSLLFGLGWAVFGLGIKPLRETFGSWWPVPVAALGAAAEYLAPHLFPTPLGEIWTETPQLFLIVSLTGLAGATFLLLLVNCVLAQALERDPGTGRSAAVLAACLAVAAGWSQLHLGTIEEAEAGVEPVRVAVIQPHLLDEDRRRVRAESSTGVIGVITDLVRWAVDDDSEIQVVVLPEGALNRRPSHATNDRLTRLVEDREFEIWTGAQWRVGKGEDRKLLGGGWRIQADGTIDPPHQKNVLIPFGEYMPLADVFPALQAITGRSTTTAGDSLQLFETDWGRLMFVVCFEATRPRYLRQGRLAGADFLVNVTYEGWFGDTAQAGLHLRVAASQSALLGVPQIRAGATGISAIIDARGIASPRTVNFEPDVLVADVRLAPVPTPYVRLGDWFAGVVLLLSFGGLAWAGRKGQAGPRRPWIVVGVYLLTVPGAFHIDPHVPPLELVLWGAALLAAVIAARGRVA